MNKEQAAKALGISVRTLQRYMAGHRIGFTERATKTGKVADFDKAEVQRFKDELKAGRMTATVKPVIAPLSEPVSRIDGGTGGEQTALAPVDLMQRFAAMLQAMQSAPQTSAGAPAVQIENKFMLSLVEASQLSGVSVARLREAIHAGELGAHKGIGRGLGKVKRTDLEAYINGL